MMSQDSAQMVCSYFSYGKKKKRNVRDYQNNNVYKTAAFCKIFNRSPRTLSSLTAEWPGNQHELMMPPESTVNLSSKQNKLFMNSKHAGVDKTGFLLRDSE